MKPTILFLFNSSPYASAPWVAAGGYNVVHVDYDGTDHSDAHSGPIEGVIRLNIDLSQSIAVGLVLTALVEHGLAPPSLVVSFPPCTDLAVSGARHFATKLEADPDCQNRAVRMAQLAQWFACPYIVENPISVLSTKWRKPDYIAHPWQFSYMFDRYGLEGEHPEFPSVVPAYDWYNKKTCYWTGNGFQMPWLDTGPGPDGNNPGWEKLGGKGARTKYIRSLTPRGFAYAVYHWNHES